MLNKVAPQRSYRCYYHPKDSNGWPVAADAGILPSVRVRAATAEAAQIAAHHVTGCPIAQAERLDEVAA